MMMTCNSAEMTHSWVVARLLHRILCIHSQVRFSTLYAMIGFMFQHNSCKQVKSFVRLHLQPICLVSCVHFQNTSTRSILCGGRFLNQLSPLTSTTYIFQQLCNNLGQDVPFCSPAALGVEHQKWLLFREQEVENSSSPVSR